MNIFKQTISTIIPSLVVLLIAIIANKFYDVRIISMTRDVSSLGKIPSFYGFISSLGILLWMATVAICFFTSTLLKTINETFSYRFMLSSAILSSYLLIDDLFLLHEHSGVLFKGSELFIYALLGVSVFLYLIIFKSIILKTNYLVLILALFFLFASISIDSIQPFLWGKGDLHAFLEDGTKWIGICFWCSYYAQTSFKYLSQRLTN